jgi:hypothetical protein
MKTFKLLAALCAPLIASGLAFAQQARIPNLQETYPIDAIGRITAIEKGLTADELQILLANQDIVMSQLGTPTVTVTVQGTVGSTTYTYVVAALSYFGAAPATGVSVTTGNASLNASNFNQIAWTQVAGALAYGVYRSTGGSTQGLIATVLPGAALAVNDTNLSATLNVPTANTTGQLNLAAPIFSNALILEGPAPVTVSSATGVTLTTAQILTALTVRAGSTGSGYTDTTPTAVALVAALPGVKAGSSYGWTVRNTTANTMTLAAGTGVTLAAGNTNTTATSNNHSWRIVFTNVTPGSEAVTIYSNALVY